MSQSFLDPELQLSRCLSHFSCLWFLMLMFIFLLISSILRSAGFCLRRRSLWSISLAVSEGTALKVLWILPAGMVCLAALLIVFLKNF